MKKILSFLLIGILLLGCSPNLFALSPTATAPPTPNIQFLGTHTYYTFLVTILNRPDFCLLTIRLPMKISSAQLALLSEYIYQTEGPNCPAGFYEMSFFLPGDDFDDYSMGNTPGNNPWAGSSVGFDGVRVHGQILEDEMPRTTYPLQKNRAFLGIWLDTRTVMRTITITLQDDAYEMITTDENGTEETQTLFAKTVDGETRLYENENMNGEYMIVRSNGNLAFYDQEGLIQEIEK